MTQIDDNDIKSFGKVLKFIGERLELDSNDISDLLNNLILFNSIDNTIEQKSKTLSKSEFKDYLNSFTIKNLNFIISKYSIPNPKSKRKSDLIDSISDFF